MSSFSQTPDKPRSFGYKTSWFALAASDPAAVVDALGLGEATAANWASGRAAAHPPSGAPWLFVSPPVGGWVLAVGANLPCPSALEARRDIGRAFDAAFSRLMRRFDEVQFFGSHRVVDYAAWARARNGEAMRVFSYADGQVLMNLGPRTPEEAKLGFADLSGLSPAEAEAEIFRMVEEQDAEEDAPLASGLARAEAQAKVRRSGGRVLPDESDVLELAALWSLDPIRLAEQDHPASLGLAVRLAKSVTG